MVESVYVGVILLEGAILGTVVIGLRRQNVSAVVNAVMAFAVTSIPVFVETIVEPTVAAEFTIGPGLPLWIGSAGFLHSLGMLGLYESTTWWDHLTHTVSAALVAALVYAGILVTEHHSPDVILDQAGIIVLTLVFTVTIGLFWELVELVAREVGERYGVDPILVHYGWRDTAYDLGFDLLGASFILVLDLRIFVRIFDQIPGVTRLLLGVTGGLVVVGGVLIVIGIGLVRVVRQEPE